MNINLLPKLLMWAPLIYLFFREKWVDLYHLVIGGVVVGLLYLVKRIVKREREKGEEMEEEEEETPQVGKAFVVGIASLLIVVGVLSAAFWVADQTPISRFFLDRDCVRVEHDIELLSDAGNWAKAEEVVTKRLNGKTSASWRKDLAQEGYELILKQGEEATALKDRQRHFQRAAEWAKKYGLRPGEAEAKYQLAQPTLTPLPTHTPYPTASPPPTYTPLPTSTPYPTYTPEPTVSGIIDCIGERLGIYEPLKGMGYRVVLYHCANSPGYYKIDWYPRLSDTPYGKVVKEKQKARFDYGAKTLAAWVEIDAGNPVLKMEVE
jgi:hypothetical protein